MSAAPTPVVYRVDNIEVDATRGCVRRDGEEIHLKPKTFRLLLHLVTQRDRLITKEELMEHFWKDTAVTDDALTQCIAEVRRALGDNPKNPTYLKTVPRRGYRFVGTVEVVQDGAVGPEIEPSPSATPVVAKAAQGRWRLGWIAAAALVAVSIGGAAFWNASGGLPASQGKRQIALIRFENRSGQSDLDWLSDGLPEMLATTLSRSKSLEVIGREQLNARTSRSAKSGVDAAIEQARRHHAYAAVVGSFSKLGDSMRVDVQVYEARKGSFLGAESITVLRQDQLLAQVDFLAARLAQKIAPQNHDHDRRELASLMTENLEAYRYYSLGMEKAEAFQIADAIALFETALKLDPGFVMAYARIGYAHAVTNHELSKGRPYLEKAFKMSGRLTEKDRHHILAWYAIANQEYQTAIRHYSDLISEYPNEAEAYFRLAMLLRGESRHEEAAERLRQAIAIDPEDPKLYNAVAAVSSEMGRHDDAIAMAARYLALSQGNPNAHDSVALSYQLAGRFDQAVQAYDKALELKPDFQIAGFHRAALMAQMGRFSESVRESLELSVHGAGINEKRRGLEQAARAELLRGRAAQAKAFAAKAIEFHPEGVLDSNPVFLLLPRAALNTQAGPYLGRGARFGERSAYYFLAEDARMKGRSEERLAALRQLLKARTSWGEPEPYEDALATAYFEMGRIDDAIPEFERALRVFPGMAKGRFHLGQAYQRKGRNSEAKTQFREFLNLWKQADPGLPEVAEAKRWAE